MAASSAMRPLPQKNLTNVPTPSPRRPKPPTFAAGVVKTSLYVDRVAGNILLNFHVFPVSRWLAATKKENPALCAPATANQHKTTGDTAPRLNNYRSHIDRSITCEPNPSRPDKLSHHWPSDRTHEFRVAQGGRNRVQRRSTYLPTLHGWRAIAISLVLFCHASVGVALGQFKEVGLLAVQIFFGLSGFLLLPFCSRRSVRPVPYL